jgi:hypothetical protein
MVLRDRVPPLITTWGRGGERSETLIVMGCQSLAQSASSEPVNLQPDFFRRRRSRGRLCRSLNATGGRLG